MRFGIVTDQNLPWPTLVERWKLFDQLGFDSAWDCDHFIQPSRPDGPYFEPAVIQLPVAVPVPVPVEEPAVIEAQEPPEEQAEEQAAPAAAARRPGQRVPVPSWSDVLLGVTGARDEDRRSG